MAYEEKRKQLVQELATWSGGEPIGLAKDTSNLFRDQQKAAKRKLDVRHFNEVLEVDAQHGWIEVEGMTPYDQLVDATLAHGLMPAVVPQLKSITVGGATAGVGIESSSFRYGLVHETVLAMEVLLPDGRVVHAEPDNEHRDLFYGFPNSYGTLGYALKLKILAVPVKPYVLLTHIRHRDPQAYFSDLDARCKGDADFVDGAVFGRDELYITEGRFADQAPYTSDYTFERIYYRSIRERETDYLTVHDYLWRWDTDWFWCSKNLGMQNPLIRRLAGRGRCNSRFYTRVMRWNSRWGLTRHVDRLVGRHCESVIQDVDIPIARAPEFLEFFHRDVGILPIWICPTRPYRSDVDFALFPMDPNTLYVNFGFWDVVKRRHPFPRGHHNRLVERKVAELGGIKSLYSDAYYEGDEFWHIYNGPAYDALKRKYDPNRSMNDLYEKCVLRQ
jgi:FAD/FMN-containing dehydrogenase